MWFLKAAKCTRLPFRVKVGIPYAIFSPAFGADFRIVLRIFLRIF